MKMNKDTYDEEFEAGLEWGGWGLSYENLSNTLSYCDGYIVGMAAFLKEQRAELVDEYLNDVK